MGFLTIDDHVGPVLEQALATLRARPNPPRVLNLHFQVAADVSGRDTVWIWVVLDDPRPIEMTRDRLDEIREVLWDALQGGMPLRVELPIFVTFQTKTERLNAGYPV